MNSISNKTVLQKLWGNQDTTRLTTMKEFITSRPNLQETLKRILQVEMKGL